MFAPKTSAPASGGLSISTNGTNSLFGNTQNTTTPAAGATNTTGGLFGNTSTQPKPAGSMFGAAASQPAQNAGATAPSGGLFGNTTTTQPASGGLFGGTLGAGAGAGTNTTQSGTGSSLFGSTVTAGGNANSTLQAGKSPFGGGLGGGGLGGGGLGLGGGLGGSTLGGAQNNQQQSQKPSLSVFNTGNTQGTQPLQQNNNSTVVQGVKVDLTNLLPTTKFESCADEIRSEIEAIDNHILTQMKYCNEVSDLLPTIENQGSLIPNDVEFVQGKLETMQNALENDARDIDGLRSLVSRDAAEAQVAFRAIDTLKLPLQYQSNGGGWWSVQDQKAPEIRSTRKNTLALPDDVEGDPSATTVNGVPVNLVDYFSHRSDEMGAVLNRYTGNLKEIEDHLHGVEATLNRQINDFVSSKSRDGPGSAAPKSTVNELAAVLGDVEAGIMGVAGRLSTVSEQVQDISMGTLGDSRLNL